MDPVPERVLHLEMRQPDGRRFDASIAIDTTVCGLSHGGLSLSTERDASLLARISRSRTLQHGLLGVPYGGAAASIRSPVGIDRSLKRIMLVAFAQAAGPIIASRAFVPEAQVGLEESDVNELLSLCGLKRTRREKMDDADDYVGLTVALAAIAALKKAGVRPSNATASVEGFGKVGSNAALELHERGVKVVAISTREGALFDADGLDVPELVPLAERVGDAFVRKYSEADRLPASELRSLSVDLFCPCALPGGIDAQTAGRLRCKAVVPGATVPFKPGGERMLEGRGVVYVPDVLAACGGVMATNLTLAGFGPSSRSRFIEEHYPGLLEWLEQSARSQGVQLGEFVQIYSSLRFQRMKHGREGGSGEHKSRQRGLWGQVRRLCSSSAARRLDKRSVKTTMLPDESDPALNIEWATTEASS